MHSSRINFIICRVLPLGLLLFPSSLFAQQFTPPAQITQSGHIYKLAYKQVAPNGRAIYEYTTNEESIDKWTKLVTLNYAKGLNAPPVIWASSIQSSLDANKPKPHYKLYTLKGNGYARIIYEPDMNNSTYESNVHKSFHLDECGGLLVYQYAVKYPPSSDQTDAGKLATLTSISNENAQISSDIEHSDWTPICSN